MDEDPASSGPRPPSTGRAFQEVANHFAVTARTKATGLRVPNRDWHELVTLQMAVPASMADVPDSELVAYVYDRRAAKWRVIPRAPVATQDRCQDLYGVFTNGSFRQVVVGSRHSGNFTFFRVTDGPAPPTSCDPPVPEPTPVATPPADPAPPPPPPPPPPPAATPALTPPAPLRVQRPARMLAFRKGRARVACKVPGLASGRCTATLLAPAKRGSRPRSLGRGAAAVKAGTGSVTIVLNRAGRKHLRSRKPRATLRLVVSGPPQPLTVQRAIALRR